MARTFGDDISQTVHGATEGVVYQRITTAGGDLADRLTDIRCVKSGKSVAMASSKKLEMLCTSGSTKGE